MVFSSIIFLFCFLPAFLLLYYLVGKKYKNPLILVASILFYVWGAPRFIFVILGTTVADFFLVKKMDATGSKNARRLLLLCSLSINLGLLFYFKYANFFVDNLNELFALFSIKPVRWVGLALPIGISFYTFETITYVVDVYRRVHKPLRNFWDYQLYIILFPKLIAGPIIRYHDFAEQIYDHVHHETLEHRLRGFYRFVIGLGKKVMIANVLGSSAMHIAGMGSELDTVTAWIGAVCYAFQIYFDFSGYSDMAIGLGMMMGFRFPENFNNPYTSLSVTDFWRRWHITLGSWMRNYLYIPLGGNRVNSKARLLFNLWLVFALSGLWHGAAWGFIIWGLYHGFFLVIERFFLLNWLQRLGKASVIYTFLVVVVGWVFFRAEHWAPAIEYLGKMFSWHPSTGSWRIDTEVITIGALAALFSFFTLMPVGLRIQQKVFYSSLSANGHRVMTWLMIILLVLCAGRITVSTFNPFIYFRF